LSKKAAIIAVNAAQAAPGWQAVATGFVQHFMTGCFESRTVNRQGDKVLRNGGSF
jgi:hypothetical protein